MTEPKQSPSTQYYRVAVPLTLYKLFDYSYDQSSTIQQGSRVVVPFGHQTLVGIVVKQLAQPSVALNTVLPVKAVIDEEPVLTPDLLKTLLWVSEHYHQPLGEILWTALPSTIRGRRPQQPITARKIRYQLTPKGQQLAPNALPKQAKVQMEIFNLIRENKVPVSQKMLSSLGYNNWRVSLKGLENKGLVESVTEQFQLPQASVKFIHQLTDSQTAARDQILSHLNEFRCFLLYGVTGSGKTEVYLHAFSKILEQQGQVLLLVPEIGLTPQLKAQVQAALGVPVASYHSSLSASERHRTWWSAKTGEAQVVIGTRSAVFLPFANLAMIVIDEEHDSSFKQQQRVSYHARSVAIYRAAINSIPLIFGTATPSLETVHAVERRRVQQLSLPERVTKASMPTIRLIDLKQTFTVGGLSVLILQQIQRRIERREQSLIFINRRGYAPVVICADCKWVASCDNCDINLNFHASDQQLHCHHCMQQIPRVQACPVCLSERVQLLHLGTQRVENSLQTNISGARILRIDRDTTRSYAEFEHKLNAIQQNKVDILIGTQMLAKGHHFPNVTLVCILNVDYGFYSLDLRAKEHMVQQVFQVAGRAGRAEKPGEVYIQTHHPDHDVFNSIKQHDYMAFSKFELQERYDAEQPPFYHYSLLRANSPQEGQEIEFLQQAKELAVKMLDENDAHEIRVFDIVQSPIQKISNRYRAQLLCGSRSPSDLRRFLKKWMLQLSTLSKKGKLRWRLDVDPISFS